MEQTDTKQRRCSTCRKGEGEVEFYASPSVTECKPCKRIRSRRNRSVQARKVAAVERLIELLAAAVSPADKEAS